MLSPSPSLEARSALPMPPPRTTQSPVAAMLKINSLLNPTIDGNSYRSMKNTPQPQTPAMTTGGSTPAETPGPNTSSSASPYRPTKLVKDAALFIKADTIGDVNYRPYDSPEDRQLLTVHDRRELAHQHSLLKLYPSGEDDEGFVREYPRHIPYSSEKKDFFNKTGKTAFDVFQYTFTIPDEPKNHVVMWHYQIGIVRITPFFKACKYSKTTPAKAINATAGLKDLCHSITGGALAAQGYWMPYACARAVCLTFCYHVRWALTPVFGASIVNECLPPSHANFGRFKIDEAIVRTAAKNIKNIVADSGKRGATAKSPAEEQNILRNAAAFNATVRPIRAARTTEPQFRLESPFESGTNTPRNDNYTYRPAALDSPSVSPKSQPSQLLQWNSVNAMSAATEALPPTPPRVTRSRKRNSPATGNKISKTTAKGAKIDKPKHFTAADFRAACTLLNLKAEDTQYSAAPFKVADSEMRKYKTLFE